MNIPLELRFIPKWLGAVVSHYDAKVTDFESIVSKHDLKLFKLSNYLLRGKLELMRIRDFSLPIADLDESYTEDDALFALYGQNPEGKTVPQFHLTHFEVVDDTKGGIIIIEKEHGETKDLTGELLTALATYRGRDVAYGSDSFKRYLVSVSNDHINTTDENLQSALVPAVEPAPGGDVSQSS